MLRESLSFDEEAILEAGAGSDEGDEVRCGDRSPTSLGGLDEFEDYREGRGWSAGAAGGLGPKLDGGEGLEGIRRPEMDPVLGGEVVERQPLAGLAVDLLDGLGELCPPHTPVTGFSACAWSLAL